LHRNGDDSLEFGICAETFNNGVTNVTYIRSDALLWPQDGFFDFKPVSNYSSFVYVPAILLVIVALFGSCGLFALCYKTPSEFANYEVALSFWMSAICLTGVQLVFSLYLQSGGCYYATAGQGLKTTSTVIVTFSVILIYGTHSRLKTKLRAMFATVQFTFMFIYACLVLASAVTYSNGCGDMSGFVLALLCLFSLLEGPLAVGLVVAVWYSAVAIARILGIYAQVEANLKSYLPSPIEQANERARMNKDRVEEES